MPGAFEREQFRLVFGDDEHARHLRMLFPLPLRCERVERDRVTSVDGLARDVNRRDGELSAQRGLCALLEFDRRNRGDEMRPSSARALKPENRRRRAIGEAHAQPPVEHDDAQRQRAYQRIEAIVGGNVRFGLRLRGAVRR